MKKDPNKYPKGWNAGKVRRVLDHYENQSDADAAREIDRAASHEFRLDRGSNCVGAGGAKTDRARTQERLTDRAALVFKGV